MAEPPDTKGTILNILQSVAQSKKPLTIAPNESLFDSGVLDSFALPELVTALEEAFKTRIPDSDLNAQTFESVNKIVSYIQSRS